MTRTARTVERTPITRRAALGGLSLVPVLLAVPSGGRLAAAASPPAARFVDTLGQKVIAVLRDERLDRAGRLERLTALLDEATDLQLIARLVLGRYWREASEPQRREYVALFRELVLKTMADRLDSYGGETYEILGARPVDERDTMVSTRIRSPASGSVIGVEWRVREQSGRLLLVDIVAEGVSMVVTQRSEAAEIAGRTGVDGLLEEMRRRTGRVPA